MGGKDHNSPKKGNKFRMLLWESAVERPKNSFVDLCCRFFHFMLKKLVRGQNGNSEKGKRREEGKGTRPK